jgi:hypothetical protein
MADRLLDVERSFRRSFTKALVPVSLDVCPSCCGPLDSGQFGQMALFSHGGYGATKTTTTLSCGGCTWALVVDVTETRPI